MNFGKVLITIKTDDPYVVHRLGESATGSIAHFSGSLASPDLAGLFLVATWRLRLVAPCQKAGKMHTRTRPAKESRIIESVELLTWVIRHENRESVAVRWFLQEKGAWRASSA
jgi:hypothetical protein